LQKTFFVYLLASKSRRLYVGVTSNLERRLFEHKQKLIDGFTESYNIDRLVFFEETNDVRIAIEREKEIKKWRREKKIALIETMNPVWADLSEGWNVDGEKADFSPMKPDSK
jgi:putative endonuclease